MLTEGNFTRDEWNNVLHLLNISHLSSLCCAQNFSLNRCTRTMAKRMQEQSEENEIVARYRSTAMNLTSSVSKSSSSVNSPIAPKSPEILKAPCRTDWSWSSTGKPDSRNLNHHAASSSRQDIQDIWELHETRKPKAMTKIGHTISIIHEIMCCTWRSNARPLCVHSYMENILCLALFKL